jgi:hypothetical protein
VDPNQMPTQKPEEPDAPTGPDGARALLDRANVRDVTQRAVGRSVRLLWTAGGLATGSAVIGWQAMGAQSLGTVAAASATLLVAALGVGWFGLRAVNRPDSATRLSDRRETLSAKRRQELPRGELD